MVKKFTPMEPASAPPTAATVPVSFKVASPAATPAGSDTTCRLVGRGGTSSKEMVSVSRVEPGMVAVRVTAAAPEVRGVV